MQRHTYLLIILLLFSEHVFAVGFEQTKLHSHLGEPLDVRVGLLLDDGEDLTFSRVALASPREYHALEQTLPQSYYDVRVDIKGADSPKPVAHITSEKAIDESILILILKVKRGRGNYFKKIQLFLDAAPHMQMKKKSALKKVPDAVARFTPVVVSADQEVQNVGSGEMVPQPARGGWSRRDSYGPVQYGDSLSEIAYRLRRDKRWSNQQIMMALYQSNPDAFVNQNINQLKRGGFLNVPDDAEVQAFVNSDSYQILKGAQSSVKAKAAAEKKKIKKVKKAEETKPETPVKSKFQGRISLGIAEPVEVPVVDVMMLKRLEKLEPLYEQAMAANLRMDGIGGKVDLLAKEVLELHQKIDALALGNTSKTDDGVAHGWIGFFLLLVVNLILVTAYLYRRQMKAWQARLTESQFQSVHKNTDEVVENELGSEVMADAFRDNRHEDKVYLDEIDIEPSVLEANNDSVIETPSLIEEEESKPAHPLANVPREEKPQIILNYALSFEEMVHKRDWVKADNYYKQLTEEEYNRPRIQALLVEKLHGQGDVLGRNITLLTLFNLYEDKQWHRFCSFFDDGIWHTLQDENIISYTGKVNASEVDRVSKESALHKESHEEVFELSQMDIEAEPVSFNEFTLSDSELGLDDVFVTEPESEFVPESVEQNLQHEDYFDETLEIDDTLPLDPEEISAQLKALDDDAQEEEFEFDFSLLEPEEAKKAAEITSIEPTPEPVLPVVEYEEGSLSLELEDSDLLEEKKD